MHPQSLDDWLRWQESLNPKSIDLGLERCAQVAGVMALEGLSIPVVTVAGTNGKGSCIALLESILAKAGYRVAAYTSPYLHHYNESLRLAGVDIGDDALMDAFKVVEGARGDVPLTCFEFRTLAALDIIRRAELDVALLEVGLGGRLDAVNLLDADVAVITTLAVDHADWLGEDREVIAREKAGILRRGRPAVCGDPAPPASLVDHARELVAPLYVFERDFELHMDEQGWFWHGLGAVRTELPPPALNGPFQYANAATALMVLECLTPRLSVPDAAIRDGIAGARLPARVQIFEGEVERVIDVAHNPQAARALAAALAERPKAGRTLAVFAALGDKDVRGVAAELNGIVDEWYVAGTPGPRGQPGDRLAACLREHVPTFALTVHAEIGEAYAAALDSAHRGDRVIAFGSFLTAREALRLES